MEDSDDKPPFATRVTTFKEAVQLSLKNGLTENCLFVFARALLAFEATNGIKLQPSDKKGAFTLWWSMAKPLLPAGANFDEWRYEFEAARMGARSPLGANALSEAIHRADTEPLPPQEAERCSSPKIKRLITVCYYLQILAGDNPFFIGVRDAAKILGIKSKFQAAAVLSGLVHDGILREVEKGEQGGRRATRFRYNFLSSVMH
jgi:hypothetical protein